jgi:hypothetical protein
MLRAVRPMFLRFPDMPTVPEVRFRRLRLDTLESPEFRFLLDMWNRKRGKRQAPGRADFDPLEMRPILSRLILIDVVRDPPDFRYRLAGTDTFFIHGEELTGRSVLSIVPSKQGQLVWNDLCDLIETWEPQYVQLEFDNRDGHPRNYRVLRLPLSTEGSQVDVVMVLQDFGAKADDLRTFYAALRAAP